MLTNAGALDGPTALDDLIAEVAEANDLNVPEPWVEPDPASPREIKRRMLEVAAPYPDKAVKLAVWNKPKRPAELNLIEGYVLEAVICNPDLLSLIKGSRRVALRRALENYFGHKIPDSYLTNPLSAGSKDLFAKLIAAEGMTLKRRDYRTLKDVMLALASKQSPSSDTAVFPDGTIFTEATVIMGGKRTYPLHATPSGRTRIGRGNSKLSADALFAILVETYGEPKGGRPSWLSSPAGPQVSSI